MQQHHQCRLRRDERAAVVVVVAVPQQQDLRGLLAGRNGKGEAVAATTE